MASRVSKQIKSRNNKSKLSKENESEAPSLNASRRRRTGAIDPLPNGTFRVRFRIPNGPRISRTFNTREEAEAYRGAKAPDVDALPKSSTLAQWSAQWLDEREKCISDVKTDRGHFKNHIKPAPFFDLPLKDITTRMIKLWILKVREKSISPKLRRKAKPLAHQTVQNVLNLLRKCLAGAVEAGLLTANPATDVGLPKEERTHSPWTFLTPEEQKRVMECDEIPEVARLWIVILAGICARLGEFNNLLLDDVHAWDTEPHVWIRYGKRNGATKGKEPRRVPLVGYALEAMRRWLRLLPMWCPSNPLGLAFPGRKGARRAKGKFLEGSVRHGARISNRVGKVNLFKQYLKLVGIRRNVRHHDMRHTGATSLVRGDWGGDPWSIEAVQVALGHKHIRTTERYAHLNDDLAQKAARKMPKLSLPWETSPAPSNLAGKNHPALKASAKPAAQAIPSRKPCFEGFDQMGLEWVSSSEVANANSLKSLSHLRDLNPRPTVYETVALPLS